MIKTEADPLNVAHFEKQYENDHTKSDTKHFNSRDVQQFEEALRDYALEEHPHHTLIPTTTPGLRDAITLSKEAHELKSEIAEIQDEQKRIKQHLTSVEANTEKPSHTASLSLTQILLQLSESNLATAQGKLEEIEKALAAQALSTHTVENGEETDLTLLT